MAERSLGQVTDDELISALVDGEARLRRAYGRQLALLGEVIARNLAGANGYPTPARLVADVMRVGQAEADRRLRHAEAVTATRTLTGPPLPPPLPATAEAALTGTLDPEHIEIISRTVGHLPPRVSAEDREAAERTLVTAAQAFDPEALARIGRTIRTRLEEESSTAS